ncbi:MAG: DUF6887 family protein [Elainellaceae cyanobacterium]
MKSDLSQMTNAELKQYLSNYRNDPELFRPH